jgi:Ni,Fe-hydrogenase maturation factor
VAEGGADLVIGIGNPLRGDDGVGWWLAERAETLKPTPRVLRVQQLTPELAAELAAARRVLFIDAWWPPGQGTHLHQPQDRPQALEAAGGASRDAAMAATASESRPAPQATPRLQRLDALTPDHRPAIHEEGAFSHHLDPARLLAITALLYGAAPQAWQLLIPAQAMPHGRELSAALQTLLPQGERLLCRWGAAEDLEVWGNPDPPAGSGHSHA